MKDKVFSTKNDWPGFAIRLTLGLVMFPHGAQKMFGWFGGPGFNKEMEHLTGDIHLAWIVSLMVILIEFFGSISLIIGLASRLWAVAFGVLFVGIIYTEHWHHGFFMNWAGSQSGEGFEYHLLVIGLCVALLINGGGKFAFDKLIAKSRRV